MLISLYFPALLLSLFSFVLRISIEYLPKTVVCTLNAYYDLAQRDTCDSSTQARVPEHARMHLYSL